MSDVTLDTTPTSERRRIPWLPVLLLALGILVMAITAFFLLIDHHLLSPAFLVAPILAGIVAAVIAWNTDRLGRDLQRLWAAGLVFTGLLAFAVAFWLMNYVLPFDTAGH